jgi:hypothetical protein
VATGAGDYPCANAAMNLGRWLTCLLVLLFGGAVAVGHAIPQSSSVWEIDGNDVSVRYEMPSSEVWRLLSQEGANIDPGALLSDYLKDRITVERGSQACSEAYPPSVRVDPATGAALFRGAFRCLGVGRLTITSTAFFDVSPSHAQLARVLMRGEVLGEFVFTRANSSHVVAPAPSTSQRGWAALVIEYGRVGISHIASGPDHLAFLLGLLLIAPSLRRMCLLTSGFTVGHSATLVIVSTNLVAPRSLIVEGLVAFSILVVAAEAVGARGGSRLVPFLICVGVLGVAFAATRDSTRWLSLYLGLALVSVVFLELIARYPEHRHITQTAITLIFGLCHGMAFASGLQELRVEGRALWPALAGFNAGVEVGQLLFIAGALILGALVARAPLPVPLSKISMGTSVALGSVAAWWFVDRMIAL